MWLQHIIDIRHCLDSKMLKTCFIPFFTKYFFFLIADLPRTIKNTPSTHSLGNTDLVYLRPRTIKYDYTVLYIITELPVAEQQRL